MPNHSEPLHTTRKPNAQRLRDRVFPPGFTGRSAEFLMVALAIAMVLASLPGLDGPYHDAVHHELFNLNVLGRHIHVNAHLLGTIGLTPFFTITGIEIYEYIILKDEQGRGFLQKAPFPLVLTAGGVLGPIAMFLLTTLFIAPEIRYAWAVVTPTDVPVSLTAMKTIAPAIEAVVPIIKSLAIFDDFIGIGIIIGYSELEPGPMVKGAIGLIAAILVALILRLRRVKTHRWFFIPMMGCTICFLAIGVEASIAWIVVIGFMTHEARDPGMLVELEKESQEKAAGIPDEVIAQKRPDMHNRLEHALTPWNFWGLAMFGIVSGVPLTSVGLATVPIVVGLALGKPFGVMAFGVVAVFLSRFLPQRIRLKLPDGVSWLGLLRSSPVTGIGLTVAVLIASKVVRPEHAEVVTSAIVYASISAAILSTLTGRALDLIENRDN